MDFKIKTTVRDIEGHYIIIKGLTQEEDTIIVNIYVPNIGTPQYIILTPIKGEIDSEKIMGDFNTPLSSMDTTSSRQKINKETQALNDTLGQTDLIDTYRALHPKAAEYTLFSTAYGIFSRTDHMLGHKVSLGKFS